MIQRGIFLAIALLSIYGGMDTLAHARSAMHQIPKFKSEVQFLS